MMIFRPMTCVVGLPVSKGKLVMHVLLRSVASRLLLGHTVTAIEALMYAMFTASEGKKKLTNNNSIWLVP